MMKSDVDYKGTILDDPGNWVQPKIHDLAGPLENPTEYRNKFVPSWHQYPTIPDDNEGAPNFDVSTIPSMAEPYKLAVETKSVVPCGTFGPVNFQPDDEYATEIADLFVSWGRRIVGSSHPTDVPTTNILYPIIDATSSVRIDRTIPEEEEKAVGILQQMFYLQDLMQDILPDNSFGILAVMDMLDCPETTSVSFSIDGPVTEYIGAGDLHDTKYDGYLEYKATWGQLMNATTTDRERYYTGLPLADDFCTRVIRIYPTERMEREYINKTPVLYTVVAFSIFLFTSLLFLTYDFAVARRQRIVMNRALASGAIVNSLFPEEVRDQLYEERKNNARAKSNRVSSAAMKLVQGVEAAGTGTKPVSNSRPIADLFENTTVLFADLAGFTAWSSTRSPTQVFELLETLYQAFDVIATRRKVFKVETIGDCYLAVTGIPKPQADHAIIMIRFARDCMAKMRELTNNLILTLGEDTADLQLRVGMHTGETTAGVLRGEKGRFQLFGDTVNTAARMESTGVKGKIHISQSTADELVLKGKGHWITSREERVVAKGKGEMQTYFVKARAKNARSSSVLSLGDIPSDNDFDLDDNEEE